MSTTLDEYLAEIDRWKEAASEQTRNLTGAALDEHYRATRAWLEAKLGRRLPHAGWLQHQEREPEDAAPLPAPTATSGK